MINTIVGEVAGSFTPRFQIHIEIRVSKSCEKKLGEGWFLDQNLKSDELYHRAQGLFSKCFERPYTLLKVLIWPRGNEPRYITTF